MAGFYDQLYARKVKVWPSEDIVAFIEAHRSVLVGAKVLDIGCGAGRHALYMSRRGIDAYGIDLSRVAVEHARRWAAEEGLKARFQVGDSHRLPYKNEAFAAAIAWESLFFGVTASVRAAIREVFRVLKDDGSFLLLLKSKGDFRFRDYPRLDRHCAESEQDIPVTCFTREEIEREFSARATDLNIEISNHSLHNGRKIIANFIVSGRKRTAR
jgi:SAM-dependent methyltransferase